MARAAASNLETSAPKTKLSGRARREAIEGYLFIAPWLVGFVAFTGGPFVASFFMSFTDWNILSTPSWVGFDNYIDIFSEDPIFWTSVRVTALYTLFALPLKLVAGLGLSLLLNMKLRGIGIYRTIFYLPAVISGVAVSMMWMWIFSKDYGLLNAALGPLGIDPVGWLQDPRYTLGALIFMSLWTVGASTIIFLAGLQNIPNELYEAATIDGAGAVTKFRRVTLPMLSPTIFFLLVIGVIDSFQTFTQAYVITGGGPMRATYFYMLHLYNEAFGQLHMGYGAALAWILASVILVFTALIFKSSPLWVYYEGQREAR
ncbi:MAG: sugar ABC transporter permease [Trueperaceae bacterium]